jgi:hypothetical protein
MFPLNTILAWNINIIMNKKHDNNNITIACRAYFLQKHSRRRTELPRKEDRTKNFNTLLSDEEEDCIQDMPEAALVAAQAYLLTTQSEPGDPWENMHQAAIKSLRLVGDELRQKSFEKEPTHHEQAGKRSRKFQSP